MSPIIFTGILSPDIFFRTLRALQGATNRHILNGSASTSVKNSICTETLLDLLEQFDVAHNELLPIDKNHGHFLLCQQLAVQQRLVEDLHTAAAAFGYISFLFIFIIITNYLFLRLIQYPMHSLQWSDCTSLKSVCTIILLFVCISDHFHYLLTWNRENANFDIGTAAQLAWNVTT